MKFIHISDLHFGKTIHGVSMIDNGDQKAWVEEFLKKAGEIQPDAVAIAGDVYDRSSPSGEAVMLLDHLLTSLSEMNIPVLMVAGNHDSAERLSFAKKMLSRSQVYIAGKLEKELTSVKIKDVTFWLLPYLFPTLVSSVLENEEIREYDAAMRAVLAAQNIDFSKKNVLIAHQNVTAFGKEIERGGSESMVGGVGQIDYTAFDGFTYVALGHIHSAYPVGRPEVRYAGTPLYYHFEEVRQPEKGPLLVEIAEDGSVETNLVKIEPLHPMRRIEDSYEKVLENLQQDPRTGEYLRIVLKDHKITPDISAYLREICEKRGTVLMELLSDFEEFSAVKQGVSRKDAKEKSVEELFSGFYRERMKDAEPDDLEMAVISEAGRILRIAEAGSQIPDDRAVQKLMNFVLKQEG